MANNLFLMGFIIFLSDIYIYVQMILKNVDNINQKSNKKLTYLMDHKKKETWTRMDKFFFGMYLSLLI